MQFVKAKMRVTREKRVNWYLRKFTKNEQASYMVAIDLLGSRL